VYALVYKGVSGLLTGVPVASAPTELTALHGLVAVAFLAAYVAIEAGVHERSRRLYVALLNAGQPSPGTVLTNANEYDNGGAQ
jgi:NAD(P)H-quinone oxidoreductase subunit 5